MKKENIMITAIIIFTIVLFCIIFSIEFNNNKNENVNYINVNYLIHYHYSNNYYDISYKSDGSKVTISDYVEIFCDASPCEPIKVKEYSKDLSNKDKKLLNTLFKDGKTEVTVNYSNLDEDINNILVGLTNNTTKKYDVIEYEIDYSSNYEKSFYIERTVEDRLFVNIYGPQESTGGYGLGVKKVEFNNNNVTIYVYELSPNNETVSTVITTPKIKIELYEEPLSIKVIDSKNNEYTQIEI